jgi:hypothetical protein
LSYGAAYKGVRTERILADISKEDYGSKRAVLLLLLIIMMMMMMIRVEMFA